MAFKYIGNINKEVQYLCLSTDVKGNGDLGSRLYEYNTGKHYINVNDTNGWEIYKQPENYSSD